MSKLNKKSDDQLNQERNELIRQKFNLETMKTRIEKEIEENKKRMLEVFPDGETSCESGIITIKPVERTTTRWKDLAVDKIKNVDKYVDAYSKTTSERRITKTEYLLTV